ncbi:c-type cytochrome [Oceanithermus sp.]
MKKTHAIGLALVLLAGLAAAGFPWPTQSFPKTPPPPPGEYPQGELGEMVKLGEAIVMNTNTHPLTKDYVGNDLQCKSCHLNGGKTGNRYATYVGVAPVYPAYSPREKAVVSLEDRVLNCFMRSMNGTRPPVGSKASIAMAAYITWLSSGLAVDPNPNQPVGVYSTPWPDPAIAKLVKADSVDVERGKQVYEAQCAACHGADGQGVGAFPPVWGDRSYNAGAGMANVIKGASWVKYNMPLGNAHLSDQEAVDVMAYVNSHPRPSFKLTDHLAPAGEAGVYNSNVPQQIIEAPTWPPKKK